MSASPAPVLLLGDPRLRRVSRPVGDPLDSSLAPAVERLHATLEAFRRKHGFGRAIAAPQIGVDRRFIAFHLDGRRFTAFDPRIAWTSEDAVTLWDDCLSFPDLLVRVRRHAAVRVQYVDERGRDVERSIDEPAIAELFQHEIDHLDGILAVDRAIDRDSLVLRAALEADPDRYRAQVDLWYARPPAGTG